MNTELPLLVKVTHQLLHNRGSFVNTFTRPGKEQSMSQHVTRYNVKHNTNKDVTQVKLITIIVNY